MHMVPDSPRDADAANGTRRLQSCRDVRTVTVQVGTLGDHVADVDPDAEPNAPVRRLVAIIDWHLLLHLHRATDGPVDGIERDQQRIAAGLHHAPAMLADRRIDQRSPQSAQSAQRPRIVQADRRL